MKSPFDLKHYFFPFVNVAADVQFEAASDESGEEESYLTDFDVKVSLNGNEQGIYQLALEINAIPESEDDKIPYLIKVVVIGVFDSHGVVTDEMEKLIKINGASLLYSAAREFIITITSRGPFNAIIIPTYNFLSAYQRAYESEDVE